MHLGITDVLLVGQYVLLLTLPGGILAVAAGLRGWTLAASAPLLTYAIVGLGGPWAAALGWPWSFPVMLGAVAVLTLTVTVVRLATALASRGGERPVPTTVRPPWTLTAHLVAVGAVVVAALVGAAAILRGIRRLDAVPQDWDAVFHANGIRWIVETGDAGLFGMSHVNWYEPGLAIYYPNAYHLLGAVVRQLGGADIAAVLNAHTVLIPGLAALVLAAVVRRFGGSVVHVVGTALAVSAVTALYDMLWRGPLLPYATGVALTPVVVVLVADLLDARSAVDRVRRAAALALALAGLLCLHPAMLFGAALLAVPYLLGRWIATPAALLREPVLLVGAGIGALALCGMQVAGVLASATGFPPFDWPADLGWGKATAELLTFGHASTTVQVWLAAAALVGVVTLHRLNGLRWVAAAALATGALFVLTAASDAAWVNALTRPWWNDRWRLAGLFALAMCVLIGHGLAQGQRAALWLLGRVGRRGTVQRGDRWAMAGIVVVGFIVLSNGLYLERNGDRMASNVGEGPAVSSSEVAALRTLDRIVPDGVRVLNDRNDGSVWMYALSGTLPVAGHYDATNLDHTDAALLGARFNRYADDPLVRAAVERLDVGYVIVADGFLRGDHRRAPGLTGLQDAPFLQVVYRNADVTVYEIVPEGPDAQVTAGLPAVAAAAG